MVVNVLYGRVHLQYKSGVQYIIKVEGINVGFGIVILPNPTIKSTIKACYFNNLQQFA